MAKAGQEVYDAVVVLGRYELLEKKEARRTGTGVFRTKQLTEKEMGQLSERMRKYDRAMQNQPRKAVTRLPGRT